MISCLYEVPECTLIEKTLMHLLAYNLASLSISCCCSQGYCSSKIANFVASPYPSLAAQDSLLIVKPIHLTSTIFTPLPLYPFIPLNDKLRATKKRDFFRNLFQTHCLVFYC